MLAATAERYGGIDVLYNNAGILPADDDSVLDDDVEAWDRVQDVNTRGVFLCCKHGIPHLLERGGGSVINVASFVAIVGAATSQISYTASKGAVLSMRRELGVQFARQGVRVNALCPGPVETPLLMRIFGDDPAALERRRIHLPMGRLGEAARDRQRRAVPRERRVVLRQRRDVPGRRRPHRRLRHARVASDPSFEGRLSSGVGRADVSTMAQHDIGPSTRTAATCVRCGNDMATERARLLPPCAIETSDRVGRGAASPRRIPRRLGCVRRLVARRGDGPGSA